MRKFLVLLLGLLIAGNAYATTSVSLPYTITGGDIAYGSYVQGNFNEISNKVNTHTAATTSEHGVSGTIVGTSDTQTLTNKTIGASTVSGDMTFSTGIKAIFGNSGRYITDETTRYGIQFSTNVVIPTGKYLYFSADGDISLAETSNKELLFAGDAIVIPTTKQLRFSADGDCYFAESATNKELDYVGDALRIANGSRLHIGATSTNNAICNATQGAGSSTLYIGNETIDTTASDVRLKKNITSSKIDIMTLFNKMKVKDFEWLADNPRSKRGKATGLIAQEVYEYLPQVVRKPDNPNDTWSVEYAHLVPYLILAIQKQQTQIDDLNKRILKLEGK